MKKPLILMLAAALFLTGCNSVDLSPLEKRVAELEGKVNAIEKSVSDLNSNASGIKTTVDALKQKLTVVSVEEVSDGYKITFSDGKEAVIKDGAAGAAGAAGPQGPEGPQGPAGTAPTIGVAEVEGVLVWTVNDEAVKDKDGKVIPVSSTPAAPEFKYEKGVWYYRVGEGEWTACSEGEASAIEVLELDDVVLITIGDTVITLPKESVSAPIESIANVLAKANRLFVPVGKTIDLKEWFTVAPEGALKTMVDYTFFKTVNEQEIDLEGDELAAVPLAIDSKGVLTASGSGSYSLRISSKLDKTIKTNIVIRAGECPADEVPATSVTAQEKIQIYNGSIEEYNKQVDFGGTTSYNPANGAIAGIFNGTLNFRIGMPVTPNTNITLDNGHLYFKFYVSDASVFAAVESNFLEHTSSGTYDKNEVDYDMRQLVPTLKNGWNEIDLPLKDFTYPGSDGKYDPTQASFIRFLCNANTNGKWIVYQMKDLCVYAAEPSVTAISHVLKVRSQLFVPVGKSVDLKEWFNVEPVGANKEGVTFTPEEGAGFTVSAEGILTATEACNKSVTITSKGDANVKLKLTVRTGNVPNDNLPAVSINPAQKIAIYTGSLEEYNSQVDAGGSTNYNPFNGAVAGVFQGTSMNFRIGMPVTPNSNITRANGRIHFMLYVSDPAAFSPAAFDANHFLEVTSSGTYDQDEANFDLTKFVPTLKSGWNEIDLPFSEAIYPETGDTFDVTKTNFLRFVCTTTNTDKFETFQIRDIFAYASDAPAVTNITLKENKDPKRGLQIFEAIGKTVDIMDYVTLEPAGATAEGLTFTSSNPASVSVTDAGVLNFLARGADVTLTIASKANPDVKVTARLRTDNMPNLSGAAPTKSTPVIFATCDPGDHENWHTRKTAATDGFITTGQKEGTGYFKRVITTSVNPAELIRIVRNTSGTDEPVDGKIMAVSRLHLTFWYWIEDEDSRAALVKRAGADDGVFSCQVQLSDGNGSTGANKNITWDLKPLMKNFQVGWNYVDLAVKDATKITDDWAMNPTHLEYFRILQGGSSVGGKWDTYTMGIDDIEVYEDYSQSPAESAKQYLLHPSFDEYQNLTIGGACNWCPSEQAFATWFASGGAGSKNVYFKPAEFDSGATIANGHLHFKWYINDITKLNVVGDSNGQVELSSGGAADNQELTFISDKFLKYCQSGWNDVVLDFNRNDGDGGIDLSKINWFRFYDDANGDGAEIIKDIYVYAE